MDAVRGPVYPDDAPGTIRVLNPLHSTILPKRLQGSPSRNPAPRVAPLQRSDSTVEPQSSPPPPPSPRFKFDKGGALREYEASAAALGGLPQIDEVWTQLRDPVKGAKLSTKKRLLKTIPDCISGRDLVDWFTARYPVYSRHNGCVLMSQLMDRGLVLGLAGAHKAAFEDSDSALYTFKGANSNVGHFTLMVREAQGLRPIAANSELYCNVDVRYKKSQLSLTSNPYKTQLVKGPSPKWNTTLKIASPTQVQNLQLDLQVFAKQLVGSNTFMGQLEVPLDALSGGDTLEDWFPLQMRRQGEDVRGEILLSMTFVPVGEDAKLAAAGRRQSESVNLITISTSSESLALDASGVEVVAAQMTVDVPDPQDELAEMPYEFDDPDCAGELLVERLPAGGGVEYKAASLTRLMELMTSAEAAAGNSAIVAITDDVLIAYPTFITPLRFFTLMLKRYLGPPGDAKLSQLEAWTTGQKDIQARVGSLIARWMSMSKDFWDNGQLFSYFKRCVEAKMFQGAPTWAKYFDKKLEEFKKKRMDLVVGSASLENSSGGGGGGGGTGLGVGGAAVGSPGVSAGGGAISQLRSVAGLKGGNRSMTVAKERQVPLLDLNIDEIAEQITLIEHELFKAIEPLELLNQNWNKHPELAPNVIEYIQWFNRMSQWASTEIIKEVNPETRAVIISKFIHIAAKLAELNNFNGLMEILASLEGASIRRLKLSWAEVVQTDAETLERLGALMKPEKNFKDYRAAIVQCVARKPWIPYLGLHLTDLTFVDDGNTTWVGGTSTVQMVNLQKVCMTATVVRLVTESAKSDFYSLHPMNSIQKLLYSVCSTVFDDNEVYRLSLLREARGAGGDVADRGRGNRNRLANIAKSMMKRTNVAAEKELTEADWNLVLAEAKVVVFKKDVPIIQQGVHNTKMYMIQTGCVRVEKSSPDKPEPLVLTKMEPPKVFGEMSIIMPDNMPTVSCVADVDDTRLYMTDQQHLHNALERYPDLARRFYMTMAKKLSDMLVALVPTAPKKGDGSVPPSPSPAAPPTSLTPRSGGNSGGNGAGGNNTPTTPRGGGSKTPRAAGSMTPRASSSTARTSQTIATTPSSSGAAGAPVPEETEEDLSSSMSSSMTTSIGGPAAPRRKKKVLKKKGVPRSARQSLTEDLQASNELAALSESPRKAPPVITQGKADTSPPPPPPQQQEDGNGAVSSVAVPPAAGAAATGTATGDSDESSGAAKSSSLETPSRARKVRKKKLIKRKKHRSVLNATGPSSSVGSDTGDVAEVVKLQKTFGFTPETEQFMARFDCSFKKYQGKLVVFSRHVCFLSEMFMTTTKRVYALSHVRFLEKRSDGLCLKTASSDIVFTFSNPEAVEVAYVMISGLWGKVEKVSADMTDDGILQQRSATDAEEGPHKQILKPEDWDLMLNGAKRVKYQDGEFIIRAGESYQKIYHIVRGTCAVEVERDGQQVVINRMQEDTTFGEMSFIKQTEDSSDYKASASVIAVDEVEISIIEGYFLNILFDMYPGLEVKFFQYLCAVLAARVNKQSRLKSAK